MAFGYCKLTGKRGTFVSSHLIPKALTRPSEPGKYFVESGNGRRPVRRWDSWFDNELVIRAGEDVLSKFDADGIQELRASMLVWSGRDATSTVPNVQVISEEYGFGCRQISGVNGRILRMFFLSMLWRAAASERREVAEITIPRDHLERLRILLLENNPGPNTFYPISLTQLTEVGEPHNFAPMAMMMEKPSADGVEPGNIPTFRFYMDGLIAHVIRPTSGIEAEHIDGFHVGGSELLVATQRTHNSFQILNLKKNIKEAFDQWPGVINRI